MSTLDRCLAILRCAHTLTASGLWHAPSVRADAARACVAILAGSASTSRPLTATPRARR